MPIKKLAAENAGNGGALAWTAVAMAWSAAPQTRTVPKPSLSSANMMETEPTPAP